MNPYLNCVITNPTETIAIAMDLYCRYTGFLKPVKFMGASAYKDALSYMKEPPFMEPDIMVIDLTRFKEGMDLFKYTEEHFKNILIVLLADKDQLNMVPDDFNASNALIVLKPNKFSFIIDWIKSHFSKVCRAKSKDQCPYLIAVSDRNDMPYTPVICTSCKFNY